MPGSILNPRSAIRNPQSAIRSTLWLVRHFALGHMRAFPLRAAVQVIAIAVGVALGYAVHLINASALAEFSAAIRQTSGDADAAIVGPREGFDESVFDRVASDASVVHASPLVTVVAVLAEPERLRGQSFTIVGIDPLRAARFGSQWIGVPDKATEDRPQSRFAILDDGVYLSPFAMETLLLAPGNRIGVQLAGRVQPLTIAGRLPTARAGLAVGAMDIGFAQWRLDTLGRLTRIDLKLAPGTDTVAARRRWQLPAGVFVEAADAAAAQVSNLSRAYRVNLNVLALVALFTGSFLVYSLQAQSVLARRPQLAFLRMAGATRAQVVALLMTEAAIVGAIGSVLGIAAGIGIAFGALLLLGGDLGGGYFTSARPPLLLAPETALAFAALGVVAAMAGGWRPAVRAASDTPATALKSGSGLDAESAHGMRWWASVGAVMLIAATGLLVLPPIRGIPIAAYAAIALVLIAAIALKPAIAPWIVRPLARWIDAQPARAASAPGALHGPAWLALLRLAATPRFAGIGAAGIVASFALMVAMATMVASFRTSVDQWLERVLPAQLYARASTTAASSARFSAADVQRMRAHPGVARAEFSRTVRLVLDPRRAAVVLIVRDLPPLRDVPGVLPLVGDAVLTAVTQPTVWVSEAFASLYGATPGASVSLPIGGRDTPVHVAGVWRDYARQSGAVIIDTRTYDTLAAGSNESALPTDAALWLAGVQATDVMRDLRETLDTRTVEFAEPGEIRALSLRIFDRSFAVTYVLQLAAIAIGLVGIAATFSAQAIVRRREFGMLRHLGVTRAQILTLLALEGLLVTALALLIGLVAGLAVAWVLVQFVNPQSFHWTMEFRLPLPLIAALIAALLFAAAFTALIAGRRAVAGEAILAVREDW